MLNTTYYRWMETGSLNHQPLSLQEEISNAELEERSRGKPAAKCNFFKLYKLCWAPLYLLCLCVLHHKEEIYLPSATVLLFCDCSTHKSSATMLPVINLHISPPDCHAVVSLELITSCKMFHKSMNIAGFTVIHASLAPVSLLSIMSSSFNSSIYSYILLM